MKLTGTVLALLLLIAGCGSSGSSPSATPTVTIANAASTYPDSTGTDCAAALNKADTAFTQFGRDLTVLQRAFSAFSSNQFQKALSIIHAAPPAPNVAAYKNAEATCMADLGQ